MPEFSPNSNEILRLLAKRPETMSDRTVARFKMTFLPIVERELRVAARKGGTYWTRVIAAALAMTLLGRFRWFGRLQCSFSAAPAGKSSSES